MIKTVMNSKLLKCLAFLALLGSVTTSVSAQTSSRGGAEGSGPRK